MTTLSSLRLSNDRAFSGTGLDSAGVLAVAGTGLTVYSTLDSLPVSSLTAGDQAYVSANKRLYISNGSGWYNVALTNSTPYWDSEPNTTYSIVDSATSLIIIAKAFDSDNADGNLFWQGFASDSAQYLVNISRDSSVFTFDPLSEDSVMSSVPAGNTDSADNAFNYTFKWSDGISFVSKQVTINYNFNRDLASGGTTNTFTLSGIDYKSHAFLSGTSNFVVYVSGTFDIFLVGGGGGGGETIGGGGGGGEATQQLSVSLNTGTYSVVVGAGGAGGSGPAAVYPGGVSGGQSSFDGSTYTAAGGGAGGGYNVAGTGTGGGNGGGYGANSGAGVAAGAGNYSGGISSSNNNSGAGGGGASSAGGNSTSGSPGNGGAGINWSTYLGTSLGENGYFAAGGGGGARSPSGGTGGSGGNGGGGAGGTGAQAGTAGTANTGGGGGGGGYRNSPTYEGVGGAGGSGIVIVRYAV